MNRIHLLVGIAALTIGIGAAYAQIGDGSNQPPMTIDPPGGQITQVMLNVPDANSTLTVNVKQPEPEPKEVIVVLGIESGNFVCDNGHNGRASITHSRELTPHTERGEDAIWYSNDKIIEHGELRLEPQNFHFYIFAMDRIGDRVIATGTAIQEYGTGCADKALPIVVAIDCGVGTSNNSTGTVLPKTGSYVMRGLSDNGFTFTATYPDFLSHCQ